jgi:acetyl esterase
VPEALARLGHDPPVTLDPALANLAPLLAGNPVDLSGDVAAIRRHFDDLQVMGASAPGVPVGPTEDVLIHGRIPARIYRPESSEPAATLLYLHGGGFVIGSIRTHDRQVREIVARTGCVAVSIDYRLAPEHPWPAGVEDAWEALGWVAEHVAELGGDAARVAVAGDSAGGNLAAVLAIRARDEGGPALCGQVLIYPVVDAREHDAYPSRQANADALFLDEDLMRFFLRCYAPDPEQVSASPLLASSFAGLPPAVVVTAEHDPLCDEGVAYARALADAGVAVRARTFQGLVHGYFALGFLAPSLQAAVDETCAMINELLG